MSMLVPRDLVHAYFAMTEHAQYDATIDLTSIFYGSWTSYLMNSQRDPPLRPIGTCPHLLGSDASLAACQRDSPFLLSLAHSDFLYPLHGAISP